MYATCQIFFIRIFLNVSQRDRPLLCFRLILEYLTSCIDFNFTVFTHWKNIKDVELSEISFISGKIRILVEFYRDSGNFVRNSFFDNFFLYSSKHTYKSSNPRIVCLKKV